MSKFLIKIITPIIILFLVFSPIKAEAIGGIPGASDIAEAIWKTFIDVIPEKGNETLNNLTKPNPEEQDLGEFEDLLIDQLDNKYDFENINLNNELNDEYGQTILEYTNDIVDDIIANLENRGIFNLDESIFPFSKEDFERLLKNIYVDNIFLEYSDPNRSLPDSLKPENFLNVSWTPQFPEPGDIVNITANNTIFTNSEVYYQWRSGGVSILEGYGENILRNYIINTEGSVEKITLIVETPTKETIVKEITIYPVLINFILEPLSSNLPLTKMKGRVSLESDFKIIAIPEIKNENNIDNSYRNLSYKWYVNNELINNQSGLGKNTLTYQLSSKDVNVPIQLKVTSKNPDITIQKNLNLTPESPSVLVFENHPTLGYLFNKSILSTYEKSDLEFVLEAFPLFFNKNDILNYSWYMNNEPITNYRENYITFNTEGYSGQSNLYVQVHNPATLLQRSVRIFDIIFSN
jgi:hypothetical protein